MAPLLGCESLHLEYPTRLLFDGVTLGIEEGDRIGIVGRNGDGKSSLLSMLAGRLEPDSGSVTARTGLDVGYLAQSDELDDDATVAESIVGDTPEHVWASDSKVRSIINALVVDVDWNGRIRELSGGQRRRVDLARVLVGEHDVLFLDEPTNHLDIRAITWLADHLKHRWKDRSGALLVVTHDRWFLDEVCLNMWEVHDGLVEPFEGGYSAYVLQRVQRDEAAAAAQRKWNNQLRRELAWLSRGARARATKPKFHVASAEALIADVPALRSPIELKRAAISRLGKKVVDLIDVTERYGDKTIIDDVTWLIGPGDRYGILGENGAGKTTLLRLIDGQVSPTSGIVKTGASVRFAVLSQQLSELERYREDPVREVLRQYKTRYVIDDKEVTPAQLLERLGFEQEHLKTRVCDLSGGQKRRLQLMLILLDRPNVLILDEPGNDLDTEMLVVMEDLLDTWPGTLLLVSHDRYLMERVTDDQFALIDGKIVHVPGGVDDYLELLDERERAASKEPARGKVRADSSSAGKRQVGQAALDREKRKQLASLERRMHTMQGRIDDVRDQMDEADPTDYVELGKLETQLQDFEGQLEELESSWIELSDQLSEGS